MDRIGMPPPVTRRQFEHNVNLVIEDVHKAVDTDNVELLRNRMWATLPHLERVAYLPNRRIDLSTVNEMLRNQANMMNWMRSMPPPHRIEEGE